VAAQWEVWRVPQRAVRGARGGDVCARRRQWWGQRWYFHHYYYFLSLSSMPLSPDYFIIYHLPAIFFIYFTFLLRYRLLSDWCLFYLITFTSQRLWFIVFATSPYWLFIIDDALSRVIFMPYSMRLTPPLCYFSDVLIRRCYDMLILRLARDTLLRRCPCCYCLLLRRWHVAIDDAPLSLLFEIMRCDMRWCLLRPRAIFFAAHIFISRPFVRPLRRFRHFSSSPAFTCHYSQHSPRHFSLLIFSLRRRRRLMPRPHFRYYWYYFILIYAAARRCCRRCTLIIVSFSCCLMVCLLRCHRLLLITLVCCRRSEFWYKEGSSAVWEASEAVSLSRCYFAFHVRWWCLRYDITFSLIIDADVIIIVWLRCRGAALRWLPMMFSAFDADAAAAPLLFAHMLFSRYYAPITFVAYYCCHYDTPLC